MATTINADNGVSSGSAGLKQTADSTGVLALQTNGTTAVSISTGQVVTLTNALPIASGGTGTTSTTFANLTTNVTGTLPVANGGTGVTSSTGSGSVVLGTSPTISGAVLNSMASSVITSGTAVASTSGTAINFTSIPSWVKKITVMFDQVSTNGTSNMQIQLGTSSGYQTTSYNSVYSYNGPTNSGAAITTGFGIFHNVVGDNKSGLATFTLFGSNTWVGFGGFANLGTQPGYTFFTSGSKSLGATLDRLRITTVNGTDVFDLGSINILYE